MNSTIVKNIKLRNANNISTIYIEQISKQCRYGETSLWLINEGYGYLFIGESHYMTPYLISAIDDEY